MGGSSSKQQEQQKQPPEQASSFRERIRETIEHEMAKKAMMQREVQMAVNIAKARDTLQIFGSAWLGLGVTVALAKAAGKPVPLLVGVPIVVGALVLGNMADMAYGNKLGRVTQEAEYLLEYERARFVPMKQAPFAQFYTEQERAIFKDPSTAVGELFPSSMVARSASFATASSESSE